jgi:inner membrane protein
VAAVVSHVLVSGAASVLFRPGRRVPRRYWIAAALVATIPDIDILFVALGTRYRGMWGHRGITHSFLFAFAAAAAATMWVRARDRSIPAGRLFSVMLLAAASHGFLDGLMASGVGVAFFAPFSAARYTLPWRPIRVPPPSDNPLLNVGGIRVTASEILWLWMPSLMLILAGLRARASRRGASTAA